MKSFVRTMAAVMAAASLVLAGCGGGGGGGGGGGSDATPLALSVKINGAASAAADSYNIKPGDSVEVSASQASTWSVSPTQVQAQGLTSTASQWSAQLINALPAASTLTLSASAGGNAVQNKTINFNVAAADARNGSYKIYSTGGPRATLNLNFDLRTYKLSESNFGDPDLSGAFHEDGNESGTFVFDGTRAGADASGARFRVSEDAVVGAYPLARLQDNPLTYPVTPFIGSRAWVTAQAQLDGYYNRLGTANSFPQMTQILISDGGTKLKQCSQSFPFAYCPNADFVTYTVAPASTQGLWNIVDGTGTTVGSFGVAVRRGENVYLSAGRFSANSTDTIFRIGLREGTTWSAGQGWAVAAPGSWGKVSLAADGTMTHTATSFSGATANQTLKFNNNPMPDSTGFYADTSKVSIAFVGIQRAGVFAFIGNTTPVTVHLGLLD